MDRNAISTSRNGNTPTSDEPSNEIEVKLDRVNELWGKLEKKLLKRQPPRLIELEVDRKDSACEDGPLVERHYLGIRKNHGKWRICYAVDYIPDDPDMSVSKTDIPHSLDWRPIAECDLETRLMMTKEDHLEKLKFEVDNTGTFFLPQLNSAISRLEDLLDD